MLSGSVRECLRELQEWEHFYNFERPHAALKARRPMSGCVRKPGSQCQGALSAEQSISPRPLSPISPELAQHRAARATSRTLNLGIKSSEAVHPLRGSSSYV